MSLSSNTQLLSVDEANAILKLERDTLTELFHCTNGYQWNEKKNWLSNQVISNWYGIKTGKLRIIKLGLWSNNLYGIC